MTRLPAAVGLVGAVRDYPWGSRTSIQRLLGIEPDGAPIAELWFGAHADDPSPVAGQGGTLDEVVAEDPVAALGEDVARDYGGRLPFLLKILAAETALSIQVHPSLAQARDGFAREDAAGVPRPAPERNYRDRNHKPELICALTEFEALCGFRPVDRALALLDALAVPELDGVRTLLAGPDGIRAAFTMLLTDDDPHRIVDALVRRAAEEGDDTLAADALHVVRLLADDFPGDVGIALSLLLNYVRLQPGEAIFLGAGNVHCYLRGTGVEVMANSDNVLRCALTPKHVDVDEVLAVTDFTALAQPRCARRVDGGRARFEVPVADFDLTVVDLDGAPGALPLAVDGPCIVLCTDGQVSVSAAEVTVEVARGHAAFLAAGAVPRALRGAGRAFVAGVGATSRT